MFGFSLLLAFFLASIQLVKLSVKQSKEAYTVNRNCNEMGVRFKRMSNALLFGIVFGILHCLYVE